MTHLDLIVCVLSGTNVEESAQTGGKGCTVKS